MSLKPENMKFNFDRDGQSIIDELIYRYTDINVASFIIAILDKFDPSIWTDVDAALSSYLLKKQLFMSGIENEPS